MYSGFIRGWINKPNEYDLQYNKGYISVSKQKNLDSIKIAEQTLKTPNEETMIAYHRIIQMCALKNIKLFVIISPMYNQETKHITNLAEIKSLFEKPIVNAGFKFIDFTQDSICDQKAQFADHNHLKNEGAHAFSIKAAQKLTQYIAN